MTDETTNQGIQLTTVEARVLAALFEKSLTTPKYYPMTTNAIMLASNQKNSRNPVMQLTEGEIGHALNELENLELVKRDDSSARATKWRQRFRIVMGLEADEAAVLAAAMLRGAQTKAELRSHAEPMHGPTDNEALERCLQMLQLGSSPKLLPLERQAGQKEGRFVHTICGAEAMEEMAEAVAKGNSPKAAASNEVISDLESRVAALEEKVAKLAALLD